MDGWLGKGIEVFRDGGWCGKKLNLKEWCLDGAARVFRTLDEFLDV